MPAGLGEAGHRDRCRAAAGALLVHRDGWGFDVHPPMDTSSGDVAVITQALADRFARSIAAHPADWHMMQPQWLADLSDERRAKLGTSLMRIGMVCPYSFDVPGGVQSHVLQLAEVMHGRRPRRQRAGAVVAAREAARLRGVRRQGGADPVQRVGGPAAVRARPPTAWSSAGWPTATSTCCTCTSPTRRACRCWR